MKREALAAYLECKPDDLEQANHDKNLFEYGMESYLILTDDEADEYTSRNILDSLWAFNAEFVLPHSRLNMDDLDDDDEEQVLKALKLVQEKLCENANPLIKALLENEEDFIADAQAADGRGHFLNQYDGSENEINHGDETFYIYRQN